jgi:hypothetical protein
VTKDDRKTWNGGKLQAFYHPSHTFFAGLQVRYFFLFFLNLEHCTYTRYTDDAMTLSSVVTIDIS